jgi:hypothetical protein
MNLGSPRTRNGIKLRELQRCLLAPLHQFVQPCGSCHKEKAPRSQAYCAVHLLRIAVSTRLTARLPTASQVLRCPDRESSWRRGANQRSRVRGNVLPGPDGESAQRPSDRGSATGVRGRIRGAYVSGEFDLDHSCSAPNTGFGGWLGLRAGYGSWWGNGKWGIWWWQQTRALRPNHFR